MTGRFVTLEPLDIRHAEDLWRAGQDPEIWRCMPRPMFRDLDNVKEWIVETQRVATGGEEIPFAILHCQSGEAVGSTRYLDIQRANHSLEIGWTWLGKAVQRTAVNTECKYLLLRQAFESWRAVRVQLKTDARNLVSQTAIARLGAVREGVLRKQRKMWDGHIRDTVYFSILDTEWPSVKARLERLLNGATGSE